MLAVSCAAAFGDGGQTLTVNGQEVEKVVARITMPEKEK